MVLQSDKISGVILSEREEILVWVVNIVHGKLDQIHDPHSVILKRPALQEVLQPNLSKCVEIFEYIWLNLEQVEEQLLADRLKVLQEDGVPSCHYNALLKLYLNLNSARTIEI